MGETTKNVDIALRAHDETQSGIKAALHGLRELQMEQRRSGEGALERTIKGAGVAAMYTLAAEAVGKFAEVGTENLRKFNAGSETAAAAFVDTWSESLSSIPIVSKFVEAGKSVAGFVGQSIVGIRQMMGETRAEAGKGKLTEYLNAGEYTKEVAEMDAANVGFRKTMIAMADETALAGLHGVEREIEAVGQRARHELAEASAGLQKIAGDTNASPESRAEAWGELEALQEQSAKAVASRTAEIQERANRQAEDAEMEHGRRMAEIENSGAEARLRTAGLNIDAEKQQIKNRHDEQAGQIIERANKAVIEHPERGDEIRQQANEERAAAWKKANDDLADLDAKAAREREDAEITSARRVAEIKGSAAVESLRTRHQDLEAELLELKTAHEAELAEEQRQVERKAALLGASGTAEGQAQADALEKQAAAVRDAKNQKYGADVDAARAHGGDRTADESGQIRKQAAQSDIDLLRSRAALGDHDAEVAAKKAEILLRQHEQEEQINKTLRERSDLSAEDRAMLEKERASIGETAKNELAAADIRSVPDYKAAPGGEMGAGITGVGASAAAQWQRSHGRPPNMLSEAAGGGSVAAGSPDGKVSQPGDQHGGRTNELLAEIVRLLSNANSGGDVLST